MPRHKARAWPESIHQDPAVLTLDENGRFIICRVCLDHFALEGGKKPKPVVMNARFRTRAWKVHKQRTNAHRNESRAGLTRVEGRDSVERSAQPHGHAPRKDQVSVQLDSVPDMVVAAALGAEAIALDEALLPDQSDPVILNQDPETQLPPSLSPILSLLVDDEPVDPEQPEPSPVDAAIQLPDEADLVPVALLVPFHLPVLRLTTCIAVLT